MDRRDFMKAASATGLGLIAPSAFGGEDLSAGRSGFADAFGGPFWINIHASGGWDPTSSMDPKGALSDTDPNPMNQSYLAADIRSAGNIRYAPVGANQLFFDKWYPRLVVINGIDQQTNGHDVGTRVTNSGRLGEGFPALAAFAAASNDPTLPMSFLSFGGFSMTEGIVARTRAGNLNVLNELAYPERRFPDDENSTFLQQECLALVDEAQWHRDNRLMAGQRLPKISEAMSQLFVARSGSNELKQLQAYLPDPMLLPQNQIAQQGLVALAAFRAGISVSANLSIGGFDTHGDHDNSQIPRLQELFEGLDMILTEAENVGIIDNLIVKVGSDFGRTPYYNDGNGKDHWSTTSEVWMGPGLEGNRVIGGSDPEHRSYGIDHATGGVIQDYDNFTLLQGEIHSAIRRRWLFADSNPLAALFPLEEPEALTVLG